MPYVPAVCVESRVQPACMYRLPEAARRPLQVCQSLEMMHVGVQVFPGPQLRPTGRLRIFIYELPHELVQVQRESQHRSRLLSISWAT